MINYSFISNLLDIFRQNCGEKMLCCTCSHVDIPGLNPSKGVFSNAGVRLGMNFLVVVLGSEGWQYQVAIIQNLELKLASENLSSSHQFWLCMNDSLWEKSTRAWCGHLQPFLQRCDSFMRSRNIKMFLHFKPYGS